MMPINKKTRVVCTIGPSSSPLDVMNKLVDVGMNIVRMNFSHGSFEEHFEKVEHARIIEKERGIIIPIMLDTKGPEIRTHNFEGGHCTYEKGDVVRIYTKEVLGDRTKFSVTYPALYEDCKVGDVIRLDDGNVGFKVTGKDEKEHALIAECLNKHTIKDERGVNCPDTHLNMPYLSEKDKADLIWGCEFCHVDYISASFIRNKQDIDDIRKLLKEHGGEHIQNISKVENTEAIEKLDEVIANSDGLMVARGDMGVEVNPEDVPLIQREMLEKARHLGKPIITATQMLDSMKHNPNPTRAEVSDVANAVLQGSDGVMLSAESANGEYPVESAAMEARISKKMESCMDYKAFAEEGWTYSDHSVNDAIGYNVATTSLMLKTALTVVFTKDGVVARHISKFLPYNPLLVATTTRQAATYACLSYGVTSTIVEKLPESIIEANKLAIKLAKEVGVNEGKILVVWGENNVPSGVNIVDVK